MENFYNNPAEEVAEAVVAEEAPVVEETPVVEEAPVVEAVEPAKEEPKAEEPEEQALGAVANGVIGASTTPRAPKKKPVAKAEKDPKTVAIKSTKNVSWVGVGKVSKGINIVSEKEAELWLTRDHITLVSPSDVAKEFGN